MENKFALVAIAVLQMASIAFSAIHTVSKSGDGAFTLIQAAVNNATVNDEIIILDTSVYYEQVVIDSTKNGLILRSKDIYAKSKPVIRWNDTVNVGPRNFTESRDESKITFDRNGALILSGAKRVRVEGIGVDGGGVMPFGYKSVWGSGEGVSFPLQHGNGGISLWLAGEVIIRYCDISNAFLGIQVKDRNNGGAYAIFNPSDLDKSTVPYSKFAQTGNHLFEYNRIHNNSYGMYFESTWDMGSTIRYNLFYENHHPTDALASRVYNMTSEGRNQSGGAIMTKDHLLSPLAIYNNTFWHNKIIFAGGWKAGGQHLIFNNIYSSPNVYSAMDPVFGSASLFEMMKCHTNRMFHCVIAAQEEDPDKRSGSRISVQSGLALVNAAGDLITTPYPASAEIRYLETPFLSTDPNSDSFLVPDRENQIVKDYIIDCGWEASGVKDPDCSRADLGALPISGGRFSDIATITYGGFESKTDGSAEVIFHINKRMGSLNNCKVTLCNFVKNLDTSSNLFGSIYIPVTTANIQAIPVGSTTVSTESINKISVPATVVSGNFGFFEIVVHGEGSDGQKNVTTAGFLPYRKDALGKIIVNSHPKQLKSDGITSRVSGQVTYELIDLTGKVIERWISESNVYSPMKRFLQKDHSRGCYLIRMTTNSSGKVSQHKVAFIGK